MKAILSVALNTNIISAGTDPRTIGGRDMDEWLKEMAVNSMRVRTISVFRLPSRRDPFSSSTDEKMVHTLALADDPRYGCPMYPKEIIT